MTHHYHCEYFYQGSAIINMPEAKYGQMPPGYGIQSSVPGGMVHMEYSSMPPDQLKMLESMAPYIMKVIL